MNFALTDRQQALACEYRDIGQHHARQHPCDGFDWNAWRALSDSGLWRLPVPREHGGEGGTWLDFAAAFEALTGSMRSVGFGMAVANQATLIHALLSYGSPEQQATLLQRLMAGDAGATAISERGTGTEIRALQTLLVDDIDAAPTYRLNGHKYNISLAPHASILLVAARYNNADNPSARSATALVLVDSDAPGITRSVSQSTLGVRDLPIGDIEFNAVPIARCSLLGAPRDGMKSLMQIASMNRAYFALLSASVIHPFLADALAYARTRTVLDVPLDTHQHVQRRLVDIRLRAERSRCTAWAALGQLLDHDPQALESCSIAKLSAARDLTESALDLLALHGSDGYRTGATSAFVTDALAMISAGGTEEMHRRNIFAQMRRCAETRIDADAIPETVPA
ncbi:acyl-CoA/acyl-ACP dehydrogenase [Trinickia sp. LjRoot230]|uniref:acyl-CoA dehydrogenase family protein n=1 Tax=Trinickia sp. LjRoot230 TaxID=3342288 RepID=UPI003ED12FE2